MQTLNPKNCSAETTVPRPNLPRTLHGARAFTLAELLVVIAIMAVVSTIAIPGFKGLMQSNTMTGASRQMLDDVAFARQKAISTRSKVYMVFVGPEFWKDITVNTFSPESQQQLENLVKGQYTMYALYADKNVGDQPGTSHPKYITPWRALPDGTLIEPRKFEPTNSVAEIIRDRHDPTRIFEITPFKRKLFPFPPTELTNTAPGSPKMVELPYIAFTPSGNLDEMTKFEYLPLVKGSVFYAKQNGKPDFELPDVSVAGYRQADQTNYNLVKIDPLTGRAKIERIEIP